jgi:hypothetical protein
MTRLATLALTLALMAGSTASAQTLTYPDKGTFVVTTHAQAILIRAALNKSYYEMVLANRPGGCPQCEATVGQHLFDAPFNNTTATFLASPPWGVSEGIDCLPVPIDADVWGADFNTAYGTTVAVDIDPSEGVELVDVDIPAMATLVSDEAELPQGCRDKIVEDHCSWWKAQWEDTCTWFGIPLCCDLIVAYPDQPSFPWSE